MAGFKFLAQVMFEHGIVDLVSAAEKDVCDEDDTEHWTQKVQWLVSHREAM